MSIVVEGIIKNYGRNPVLRGLTFSARAGEITLLVGPNGAGKSTIMKVLAGLIRPDGGRARIGETDIIKERIRAQRFSVVFAAAPKFPSAHDVRGNPALLCKIARRRAFTL